MFLDNDEEALRRYKNGDRSNAQVTGYFIREGLDDDDALDA
jgi:hypothetical protein